MKRPRIGVTSWHHRPKRDDERWEYIRETYTRAVYRAGGLPLVLPMPGADPDLLEAYLDSLDGLLFTGGEDVHPEFYGETVRPACGEIDRERDELELGLARLALDRGLPLLGICRGLQLLNVVCGGTLYQDLRERPGTLPEHYADREERARLRHAVQILPGTQLSQIMGAAELQVTSTHHQLICRLGQGLEVGAVSPDGAIEGIERPDHPFFLAVQWHPERMADYDAHQRALFEALVAAAGQ
ncbi:MAG: gamma-glutamyl-gamma-aminobutyrate hydrolase family protein [Candidatus Tectomicrobia bacterium]|uniref:gamma-glutamyl-gamma-aminobutyrate hydrolase n=1 Tax=Tectimicrobiota bacterium TaxID=2528274 RepID=A0A932CMP3_UNCTE|nr:gamma-glutamyl-gamma-aminobutyrate hydrolase family protein [Candidatus Tectomicrobia bacterium]